VGQEHAGPTTTHPLQPVRQAYVLEVLRTVLEAAGRPLHQLPAPSMQDTHEAEGRAALLSSVGLYTGGQEVVSSGAGMISDGICVNWPKVDTYAIALLTSWVPSHEHVSKTFTSLTVTAWASPRETWGAVAAPGVSNNSGQCVMRSSSKGLLPLLSCHGILS
jgi:hypothetical protein